MLRGYQTKRQLTTIPCRQRKSAMSAFPNIPAKRDLQDTTPTRTGRRETNLADIAASEPDLNRSELSSYSPTATVASIVIDKTVATMRKCSRSDPWPITVDLDDTIDTTWFARRDKIDTGCR